MSDNKDLEYMGMKVVVADGLKDNQFALRSKSHMIGVELGEGCCTSIQAYRKPDGTWALKDPYTTLRVDGIGHPSVFAALYDSNA